MKLSNSLKHAAGICTVAALLAGCTSSGGSQLAPTGNGMALSAVHQTMAGNRKVDLSLTLVTQRSAKPHFHQVPNVKQIKPNCCALQKTLFVTDAFGGSSFTGAVYAYAYPSGASLGSLPAPPEGWFEVQGACVDKSGNAYFANTAVSTIDEYSHSGKFIQALSDPNQFPVSCAYDRSTGNVAVSNITDVSGGPGSVSIYNGGVLQNTYYPSNMSRVYFLGYADGSGTVYLDGENSSGIFKYDKLPKGSTFKVIKLDRKIKFPGDIQWDGKYIAIGDQDIGVIYQTKGAKVVGTTQLTDGCASFFIQGARVICLNAPSADIFRYPAGGSPVKTISLGSVVQPIAVVISE